MSVMLVHVPNLVWENGGYRTDQAEIALMAMGLFAIADSTDQAGIPVEVINVHASLRADPSFDLVRHISQVQPKLVGFSVHWAKQLQSSLMFAARVAEASPHTRIVMGGFSASWFARDILDEHAAVHAVVRGDGEVPFPALARRVLDGDADWSSVPNLMWRRDGAIVENPRTYTATPHDLEGLNFARFDLLRDADFYAPTYWTNRGEIAQQRAFMVSTGRGCSFNCSFCGGAAAAQKVINNRTRYVFRSPAAVLQTIEAAAERGFSNIYFDYDPEPNGSYYHELFALVRQRPHLGQLTCCFGAWHLPDQAMIDDVRQTFARGLFQISPETWSEEARRRNKDVRIHYTNAELEQCIERVAAAGMYTQVYFGYVMPYDAKDAVYGTLQYVEYLNEKYGNTCEARNLRFSTDPGSPAFQRPQKHDIHLYASTLKQYLGMMDEANRRGYLNNLQLFTVNSMNELDNYLASQMPGCYYHLRRTYPASLRLLTLHYGFPGLLKRLEENLLMPLWDGVPNPMRHTFEAHPDGVHAVLQGLAREVPSPILPMLLSREHQRAQQPAVDDAPTGCVNSLR